MNYKHLGEIDVSSIQIDDADWDNDYTKERKNEFEQHTSVCTIPLMWDIESGGWHESIPAPRTQFYKKYYDPIFFGKLFTFFPKGYPIRILYLKLKSHSEIPQHYDFGDSLVKNHRIHIPIATNENVKMVFGEEKKHFSKGSIFEIYNENQHGVINNSNEDRIHLMVDWHAVERW